jgi:hypothetical protein
MLPVLRGVIDRRILINYRVDPDVLARFLPPPFRPQLVGGAAMAGICLIRLRGVRPAIFPAGLGLTSENAAHRAAVEWDDGHAVRSGVYVQRRDTSSRLNACVGGWIFPGIHHHAAFRVDEKADRYQVELRSDDGATRVRAVGRRAASLPTSSVFRSLDEASAFFAAGSLGYSATPEPSRFQGLELRCFRWHAQPLELEEVQSSFFEDQAVFPKGSAALDCALLMRDIEHEWHGRADLCCPAPQALHATPRSSHLARRD